MFDRYEKGMNGWIHPSRRRIGQGRRRRSCSIWPRYSHLSGVRLHRLLAVHRCSVWRSMRSYWIRRRVRIQVTLMIPESWGRERLIPTRKRNLHDQIRLIWMKMKKRCLLKLGCVLPTPRVRRLSVRHVVSWSRSPGGWLSCRRRGSWRRQAWSMWTIESRSRSSYESWISLCRV